MTKKLRKSLSDEIKSAVLYLHVGLGTLIVLSLFAYIFMFAESSQFGNRVQQAQQIGVELQTAQDGLSIEALDAQASNVITSDDETRIRVNATFIDSRLNRLTKAN